jgi:hypothetical protein
MTRSPTGRGSAFIVQLPAVEDVTAATRAELARI